MNAESLSVLGSLCTILEIAGAFVMFKYLISSLSRIGWMFIGISGFAGLIHLPIRHAIQESVSTWQTFNAFCGLCLVLIAIYEIKKLDKKA